MSEPTAEYPDGTDDGTTDPISDDRPGELIEEGDAGVNDTGTESWYQGGED